jgi:hypothetical protein
MESGKVVEVTGYVKEIDRSLKLFGHRQHVRQYVVRALRKIDRIENAFDCNHMSSLRGRGNVNNDPMGSTVLPGAIPTRGSRLGITMSSRRNSKFEVSTRRTPREAQGKHGMELGS